MPKLSFDFEVIEEKQISELMSNLNSIEGFKAYPLETEIEVKTCLVVFFLEIIKEVSVGVAAQLIAQQLYDFFKKEKATDNQPINVNIGSIIINQGESTQEIENKLQIILKK